MSRPKRACVVCSAAIADEAPKQRKTCSEQCAAVNRQRQSKRWVAEQLAKRAPLPDRVCRGCGATFAPRSVHQHFCRFACSGGTRSCERCRQPSGVYRWCSPECRRALEQEKCTASPPQLSGGARPQRAPEGEDAPSQRRMRCRRYESCLNYASRLDWPGFTCARCPVQDERPEREIFEEVLAHAAVSRQHAGSIWDNVAIEGVDIVRGQR